MPVESQKPDLQSLRINRTPVAANNASGGKGKLGMIIGIVVGIVLLGVIYLYLSNNVFNAPEVVQTSTAILTSPSQAATVLTASGYVVASRKAAVGSKGTGRLIYLGVEEGSHVKQGEIIGRLEANDVNASLQQAEASVAAAKANLENVTAGLENADSNVHRLRLLFRQGLAAQADLTSAESQYKQSLAQVASSQANLQLAEKSVQAAQVQLEFTNIRAPFDGTVLTKDADVGDIITPFGAAAGSRADIVTLADMSSLDAEVDVSEASIEQVHVGQPCEITIDAVPEKRYKGVVHMIVPTADRSKATILTKVAFVDMDSRVLPEMSLKVLFLKDSTDQTDTTGPKLTIPATAVATRNGKKVVFVMHGDVVTEVPVTLGAAVGDGIEVKSGVSAGDKVVDHPSEKLTSGAKVKSAE